MIPFVVDILCVYMICPLALPFIIGFGTLVLFWKDELSFLTGAFIIEPIIANIALYILFAVFTIEYSSPFAYLPDIILTIGILFLFRDKFAKYKLPWVFLLFDLLRFVFLRPTDKAFDPSGGLFTVELLKLYIPFFYAVFASIIIVARRGVAKFQQITYGK